jgi:rfaE bifunctional protein nucleotidyltransferase chain/domain
MAEILDIDTLAKRLSSLREKGRKVALCHGVFDFLHLGHIKHLNAAKRFGDVLVVTLTPDNFVNKGPSRPAFTALHRAEALAALEAVDFIAINKWPTAEETVRLLEPHFYVKGSDYRNESDDITGKISSECSAVEKVGGKVVYTDDISFSSSSLINKHLHVYPSAAREYLEAFKKKHSADVVNSYIDSLSSLSVVVLGEAILDEYLYGNAIGKSSKDPHLAVKYKNCEIHAGGSLAIANHLAEFCKDVQLVTYLGDRDSHEELIRSKLHENVSPNFIYKKNSPTIVKQRIVDDYSFNKLLEIYHINEDPLESDQEGQLLDMVNQAKVDKDLCMVSDFGHGFIGQRTVDSLCEGELFLALNVQCNAGNYGYSFITKYSRANFIAMDESEVRLECRSKSASIKSLLKELSKKISCNHMIVTRGSNGSSTYEGQVGYIETPALTSRVVDRVGAGDAYFSLSSLLVAKKVPVDIVAFVGNMVGAMAVSIVGNRESVSKVGLKKAIVAILQ